VKVLFFQYGDFAEAYHRLSLRTGLETYRSQRSSVDFVAALSNQYSITNICICDRVHDEDLQKELTIDRDCR
jgi:hypothetical protein